MQAPIETQATLKAPHQLLVSMVGVGDYTAAVVFAEIGSLTLFAPLANWQRSRA